MTKKRVKIAAPTAEPSASANIDARIALLADWLGTPVWKQGGILCTGEHYKETVKLTFANGASLPDPKHLFNSSLDGNVRRAIDIREQDALDQRALVALVRAAAKHNLGKRR